MKKTYLIPLLAVLVAAIPLVVWATSGQRSYQGTGQISVGGVGTIHLEGTGNVELAGNGTLSVSKNAHVKITGEGEKTVQGNAITYTGFNGSAQVWGANIIIDVSGEISDLTARGTGQARLEGDGSVRVKKIQTNLTNEPLLVE